MKRVIVLFLIFSLIISNYSIIVYAAEFPSTTQRKIVVYLKPDITVELNSVIQRFEDSKGAIVYPIIYNGSTYLPVRAISELMKEPVEWDAASKTVFIGKTLSNPNKTSFNKTVTESLVRQQGLDPIKPVLVNAYLKPEVLIMYDFVLQTFKDANGDQVYPIVFNGTTYLPIRAVSQLMNEPIEWEGTTKTVLIGDGEEPIQEITEEEVSADANKRVLKNLFEREEILYYEATAKTTSLKASATLNEKQVIASAISENYISAQGLTLEIKTLDIAGFTDDEIIAHNKLVEFAESTEYYVLVLENIAYLAAQDTDYSMLAETFLYFAMDSQAKMEEARGIIEEINQ